MGFTMSLSVGNESITEAKIQGIHLQSLVGGYEFSFNTHVSVRPVRELARYLVVHSARANIRFRDVTTADFGQFLPDQPFFIRQFAHPGTAAAQFRLPILPQQLSVLENRRDGGDLDFEMALSATGGDDRDGPNYWLEQPKLHFHLSQSDWVRQLNSTKAFNVLLLEVPVPLIDPASPARAIDQHLRRAQKHFRDGNYRECVSECRQSIEKLGYVGTGGALKQLCENRNKMDKDERTDAILDTIKHYTHLSAHSESRGGTMNYTRSDANLILLLTAAFAARRSGS
jgi:hypothetical protein